MAEKYFKYVILGGGVSAVSTHLNLNSKFTYYIIVLTYIFLSVYLVLCWFRVMLLESLQTKELNQASWRLFPKSRYATSPTKMFCFVLPPTKLLIVSIEYGE